MKDKKNDKKFGGTKEIIAVNSVTALRFLASFLVVPIFKALGGVSAAVFSTVFMLTDWIDGFLARKLKASTFFGSIFDGVTDKTFAILTFGLLMSINPVLFAIPLLIELGIIGVQNQKMKAGLNVQSNMMGKIKTWVLSASMIGSLAAVDLLNLKPFMKYVKTASLSKVGDIKDLLILLGINIPGIVFQILTINSYNKELKTIEVEQEIKDEKSLEELSWLTIEEREEYIAKLNKEDQELLREYFDCDLEEEKKDDKTPEVILNEIACEKEQLQSEYTFLEKAKILKDALFDPEYYAENKDRQIRVLTKELFNKNEE